MDKARGQRWLVPSPCDFWKPLEIGGQEGHRHLNPTERTSPKAGLAPKCLLCFSLPVANLLPGSPAGPSPAQVPHHMGYTSRWGIKGPLIHPKVWPHWSRHIFLLNSAVSPLVLLGSCCVVQSSHRVSASLITEPGTLRRLLSSHWGNPCRLKGRMKGLSGGSLGQGVSGMVPLK